MSTGTNKERIEQNNELLNQIKTTIDNLPNAGSTSGVKLFETQEAMQADTTAKEGDLAVIYRSDVKSVSNGDTITSITFPKTVVFDEAITSSYDGRLKNSSEPRIYLDISLNASRFMLYDMYETLSEIEYSSTDGVTYTRTDSNEDTYEIGETTVEDLDEHICKFMQVGGYVFGGLYQYSNVVDGNTLKVYKDIHSTDSTITGTEYELDMRPYINKIIELAGDTSSGSAKMVGIIGLNGHIYMVRTYADQYELEAVYIANQLVLNIGQGSGTKAILQSLDGSENITLELNTNSNIYRLYNGTKSYYYEGLDSIEFLGNVLVYENALTSNASGFSAQTYLRGITNQTNTQTIISSISNTVTPIYKLAYVSAPTQLSTLANDVYKSVFYGKNGVETGTLTDNVNNSFTDINAEVYSKIQNAYDNMEPRVLTDDDKTIDKTIYIIPTKLDGTSLLDTSVLTSTTAMFDNCASLTALPLLDTSNVTTMDNMFYNCKSLKTIPLLDTSNVTNMRVMFMGCTSLKTIPSLNTSNVTNMGGMFSGCTSLETIPSLDASNVTDMSGMFSDCKSLKTIPSLKNTSKATNMGSMFSGCTSLETIPSLDTSNVTTMNNMFYNCKSLKTIPLLDITKSPNMKYVFDGCTSLETIPLLDTSNTNNMSGIFRGCTNLSDESLNNILQMCINATKISNKTLSNLGLTSSQADKCKTLSNYSAFTSAGWTTGY